MKGVMNVLLTLLTALTSQNIPHVGTQLNSDHSLPPYCSPSVGSLDGKVVVEQEDGRFLNLTNVSWQLGLTSSLCYKFLSDRKVAGRVEVTYVSLKTIYSVLDSFRFPLVSSSVSCVCDCPGGPSHCQAGEKYDRE